MIKLRRTFRTSASKLTAPKLAVPKLTMPKLAGFIASFTCAWLFCGTLLSTFSIASIDVVSLDSPISGLVAQEAQPTAPPEEEADSSPTFAGRWYTHIATLDLLQDGTQVTGTVVGYDGNWNFKIVGSVTGGETGNVLTIAASDVVGAFTLIMSADGQLIRSDG